MRALLLIMALSANYCFAQNWALKHTITHAPFHEGLAEFYDTDKSLHGFINTSGEIAIPAQYEYVGNFDAGVAVVKMPNDKWGIINKNGNFVLQSVYKNIYPEKKAQGMYDVESDEGKHGLFYNDRLILPIEYKHVSAWDYPLIAYSNQADRQVLNLVTGDVLDDSFNYGSIYLCHKKWG